MNLFQRLFHAFERLLYRLFDWMYEDVFSNQPRAGVVPVDFDSVQHKYTVILNTALIGIFRDCLFVDVSRWQGDIDFVKMRAAGVKGVILKCGQGLALDPRFVENWRKAKAAGLMRGMYWFYDSRVEPKRQAKIWADAIVAYGMGELPCFFDYEENYGGDFGGILNGTTFFMEFQKLTGLPDSELGVYTGFFYWQERGINDSFWSRFWLWIAWYGKEEDVLIPKPWTQERLFGWQYTASGDGTKYGVSSKEIDLNLFVKGLRIFEVLYGDTGEAPPPDTGEEGMFLVSSSVYTMSLRSAPSVFSARVEPHPAGTVFVCDRIDVPPTSGGLPGDKWAHVVSVNGVQKDLWVAQVHNGDLYCTYRVAPGGETPVVSIVFTDDNGVTWKADSVPLTRV